MDLQTTRSARGWLELRHQLEVKEIALSLRKNPDLMAELPQIHLPETLRGRFTSITPWPMELILVLCSVMWMRWTKLIQLPPASHAVDPK